MDNVSDEVYQTWLTNTGFSEQEFQIELRWIEQTYKGEIYGFLLRNTISHNYKELYLNNQGYELSFEELQQLNIKLKNWFPSIVQVPSDTNNTKSACPFTIQKAGSFPDAPILKKSSHTFVLPPFIKGVHDLPTDDNTQKGVLKIGSVIELDEPIQIFGTQSKITIDREDKEIFSIQSINFIAENAIGMRLHLLLPEQLPPSHYLYIMDALNPSDVNVLKPVDKELWTPTLFSDEITLFYVKPLSSTYPSVPIIVDSYAYLYKEPVEELAKLGNCYEDVMCYQPWNTISKGVVGLSTISRPNVIYCTGSLISDGKPNQISRLVLTAFHCVGDQENADTLEFYWFYQSQSCNGTVPYVSTVPKTKGGADFLSGSPTYGGTDMTLLRLRGDPPQGVVELGFTNSPVSFDTPVVAIHHPGKSYKRISFASTTNTGSPSNRGEHLKPLEQFHEVIYTVSSTESGSSGCPLLLEDSQLIIGQLWGGEASCLLVKEPDYYGRLDVSYPLIEPYIYTIPQQYDVDKSGTIDTADLSFVVDSVLGVNSRALTDVTNDSSTDACDIQSIFNKLNYL